MTRMSTALEGSSSLREMPALRLLHGRPGLIDPGIGRGRLALGPAGRRRDVPDRDGDDPGRIEDRERVLGDVLAEPGDRVLVTLVVVWTDVDVPAWPREHHALDLRDDGVVVRPAAGELVRLLDSRPEDMRCGVGAFGLEVRVLVELGLVLLHERLVERPAVSGRVAEVVVGVDAGEDALRMILPDRLRGGAQRQRGGD